MFTKTKKSNLIFLQIQHDRLAGNSYLGNKYWTEIQTIDNFTFTTNLRWNDSVTVDIFIYNQSKMKVPIAIHVSCNL